MFYLIVIIVCFLLLFTVLYNNITVYDVYPYYNRFIGSFDYIKVINKNIFFVTIAYTYKQPTKIFTLIFIIKTLII